jgi:lipoprotein NlpD
MKKWPKMLLSGILYFLFLSLCFANSNYYEIQSGDNLFRIAKRFNVPLDLLLKVNKIEDPKELKVGMKIIIPSIHVVKKGDTLYSIARTYKMSVKDLMELNHISDPTQLKTGQELIIPIGKVIPSTEINSIDFTDLNWPHPGKREDYNGKFLGVVINGNKGDVVYSVSSGKVIWSGLYRGYGKIILVDSGKGLIFGYLGNEDSTVAVGEPVESGTAIGKLGAFFDQLQAQLLFIVFDKKRKVFIDPKTLYKR